MFQSRIGRQALLIATFVLSSFAGLARGERLFFPHVLSDGNWASRLAFVNLTDSRVGLTLLGFDAYGTLVASFEAAQGLEPRARLEGSLEGYFGPKLARLISAVAVRSDGMIAGQVEFSARDSQLQVTVPAAAAARRTRMALVPMARPFLVGLAIFNTAPYAATIEITAYRADGSRLGVSPMLTILPAHGKRAAYLEHLFPGLPEGEISMLEISGSAELAAVALAFRRDNNQPVAAEASRAFKP